MFELVVSSGVARFQNRDAVTYQAKLGLIRPEGLEDSRELPSEVGRSPWDRSFWAILELDDELWQGLESVGIKS